MNVRLFQHYEYKLSRRPMSCDVNPKSYYGFFKWKVCNWSLVFSVGHKNWPFGKDGKPKSVIKTFSAKLFIMIVWYSCEKNSQGRKHFAFISIFEDFQIFYDRNIDMITCIIIWLQIELVKSFETRFFLGKILWQNRLKKNFTFLSTHSVRLFW